MYLLLLLLLLLLLEILMCYHLNGIVKKYELLKTTDVPKAVGFVTNLKYDAIDLNHDITYLSTIASLISLL